MIGLVMLMARSDLNVNIHHFDSYFIEIHANEAGLAVGDGIVWTAGQTMRDNGLMDSYLRKKIRSMTYGVLFVILITYNCL